MILQQLLSYSTASFFGIDGDIATLWIDFFSTVFFAGTVAVLVWESILQRKEIEVDEYSELRQHHHDLITLQIENPETLEIYNSVKLPAKYNNIKYHKIVLEPPEKQLFQSYLAEFDLYERVWLLKEEKGKISEYEWICWAIYLERMSHHWMFRYSFNQTRTIFDDGFMDYVKEKIIDRQDRNEDARASLEEDAKAQYMKEYKKELIFSDEVELIPKRDNKEPT